MNVVVAHASPETRERFAGVLTNHGHAVSIAADAGEALASCREQTPDVIVVDESLCGEGGLLEALKSDADAYRAAVVLVERPGLNLATAVRALGRGVEDFLVEPAGDAELIARAQSAGRTKVLREELVEQSRRLESLIFEDSLTGLSNRRFVLTQLAGLVSGARRHERQMAVAMIDVDHFKAFNDRHGHAAGDHVLAAVARVLRKHLRAEDQLGRLGGEEFLALLPDAGADAAAAAAEKLRADVEAERVEHDGHELGVTISIGWASWEGETDAEILRRADEALYSAKRLGRNRVGGAPASLHRRV